MLTSADGFREGVIGGQGASCPLRGGLEGQRPAFGRSLVANHAKQAKPVLRHLRRSKFATLTSADGFREGVIGGQGASCPLRGGLEGQRPSRKIAVFLLHGFGVGGLFNNPFASRGGDNFAQGIDHCLVIAAGLLAKDGEHLADFHGRPVRARAGHGGEGV